KCLPQMTGIVRQRIERRIATLQPSCQKVYRHRYAIHFREQGDNEGAKPAKGPPIARGLRLREAVSEDNKDRRVDDHQGPQSVSGQRLVTHCCSAVDRAPSWPVSECRQRSCILSPWGMNKCISGHAANSSHGSALSTCAVCSVRRKNAAIARNPAQTIPVRLRQNPVPVSWRKMHLQCYSARGATSRKARCEVVVQRPEHDRDVPAPRETLRQPQKEARPAIQLEPGQRDC